MDTESSLNTRIFMLTVQIQEHYPELYRNLNEMYAALPIGELPVISVRSLRLWLDSLSILVANYDSVRRNSSTANSQ